MREDGSVARLQWRCRHDALCAEDAIRGARESQLDDVAAAKRRRERRALVESERSLQAWELAQEQTLL